MQKIFLVMKQELRTTLTRKSYLLFAFVFPIASLLILTGVKWVQGKTDWGGLGFNLGQEDQVQLQGFVDESGLIQHLPEGIPDGFLVRFDTEQEAVSALKSGEIAAYYKIPSGYLETGEILHIFPNQGSFLADQPTWILEQTLIQNLLNDDPALAERITAPIMDVETTNLSPPAQGETVEEGDCSRPGSACETNEFVQFIPSILVIVFYIAIITSSSLLFNSITSEKENRTIEILMVSITPRQLLAGKTLGLGTAGLLQTTVWLATMYILFNSGGTTLNLPVEFSFPIYLLAWSLVFFLGGFALYASLMAGAGALVPKMREAGVASFVVMTPLLFGYMVGLLAPMAGASREPLLVALSLFPLTSPVVMIMRLADNIVPLWQLLLSVVLLFVGAYLSFRSVAAMFHAQNLLSGQPYSVRRYFRALLGRA
jgi:ABC-2 type transport system permease protein